MTYCRSMTTARINVDVDRHNETAHAQLLICQVSDAITTLDHMSHDQASNTLLTTRLAHLITLLDTLSADLEEVFDVSSIDC